MRKVIGSAIAVASLVSTLAAPEMAQARHRYHRYYQRGGYDYSCQHERRRAANQGTLVGAIGGGILGNVVAGRHSKLGGTLIGAGVGGVVGHQIGRNGHRC